MPSWAVYPALDPGRPAGFSSRIVQGELRDRLGFSGVTITDSLAAGALKAYGSLQNRTMLAARAGVDIMLGGGRTAEQCTDALVKGYGSGALDRRAFREAVMRVLALRATLPR
jgi:beta-N-acetylhexosaminidase